MAKIDVLLPVKNGIDYLGQSLDSILAQTFADWRVLVLDHGSTDGSRELAERYQARDRRIELRAFPDARGLSGLLNAGIEISDAPYLMRHDADDICVPQRMALTLAAFDAEPDCVAIGGQADVIDAGGAPLGSMTVPVGRDRNTVGSLFHNTVAHPTATLRRDALQALGARYGNDFLQVLPESQRFEVHGLAEDYYLFGQLSLLGKCSNVPHKLIQYRWHGGNVSATRFEEQMAMSLRISRFLARSFCAQRALPWFDPAPFCNHGGRLFDVDGRRDFSAEFERMAHSLRSALGDSEALRRELSYRAILSSRQGGRMLWRYNQYRSRYVAETGDWNAVRSWLLRRLPGRQAVSVAAELSV